MRLLTARRWFDSIQAHQLRRVNQSGHWDGLLNRSHLHGCVTRAHCSPPITDGVAGRSPASASKTGDVLAGMCFDYTTIRHSWRHALACLFGLNPMMVLTGRAGSTPAVSAILDDKPARVLEPAGNRVVSARVWSSSGLSSAISGWALGAGWSPKPTLQGSIP
jgi:hypothetical protein